MLATINIEFLKIYFIVFSIVCFIADRLKQQSAFDICCLELFYFFAIYIIRFSIFAIFANRIIFNFRQTINRFCKLTVLV